MSEVTAPEPQKPPHYTWRQVWTAVLIRPGVATFEAILRDPQARKERAYKWVFWTGTLAFAVSTVVTFLRFYQRSSTIAVPNGDTGTVLFSLGCSVLFGGIFTLITFLISSVIFQASARMVGGRGTFGAFHYAYGALYAPLTMINIAVSAFTIGSTAVTSLALINIALGIYQLILTVTAIKAVNHFTTGRLLLAMVGPTIILILTLMGMFVMLYPVWRWLSLFQMV